MSKTKDGKAEVAGVEFSAMDPGDRTSLAPWHAVALAMHEVYGLSYRDVASRMRGGKGTTTMAKVAKSPAGVKFVEEIRSMVGDPKNIVRMLLESTTLQMYVDWLAALEGAKKANDHKLVHQMIKDVGLQPVLESAKKDVGPKTIVINMQGGTTHDTITESAAAVEASWEIVEKNDE